jgi:hypothetical protein
VLSYTGAKHYVALIQPDTPGNKASAAEEIAGAGERGGGALIPPRRPLKAAHPALSFRPVIIDLRN